LLLRSGDFEIGLQICPLPALTILRPFMADTAGRVIIFGDLSYYEQPIYCITGA
jgi:hypothetical protein